MARRKTGAKETPAKKAPAKKAPAKKTPANKSGAKKTPAKKTPAKKTPAEKTPAEKTPAEKTPAEKTPANKTPANKTPAKKTPARKSGAKKPPAEKTPANKTPANKTPANKSGAKKATPTKASAKRATTKKTSTKKSATKTGADGARSGRTPKRRRHTRVADDAASPAPATGAQQRAATARQDDEETPAPRKRVKRSVRTAGRKAAIKSAKKVARSRSTRPTAPERAEPAAAPAAPSEPDSETETPIDSAPAGRQDEAPPASPPPATDTDEDAPASDRGDEPSEAPADRPADGGQVAGDGPRDEDPGPQEPEDRQPDDEPSNEADAGEEGNDTAPTNDRTATPAASRPTAPRRMGRGLAGPRQGMPRRRFRPGLAALALVIVAGAAVTLLPMFLLSRAKSHTSECFRQLIQTGEGAPSRCLPHPSTIALAVKLPWFEDEALALRHDTAERAIDLTYGQATAIRPSAAARTAAVDHFAAAFFAGDPQVPSAPPRVARWRRFEGAFEDVTRIAMARSDPAFRALAFKSARAIAAMEPLGELSQAAAAQEDIDQDLARGALLCVLGKGPAGAAVLREHDRQAIELTGSEEGSSHARFALRACEPDADQAGQRQPLPSYLRPAAAALSASRGAVAGIDEVGALLDEQPSGIPGEQRLRLGAFLIQATQPEAVAALAILVPRKRPAAALETTPIRTPWALLDRTPRLAGALTDPAAAGAAAARLEQLLAGLGDDPLRCVGEECPVEVALTMPARLLREGTRMLWFDAAVEQARRGRGSETLAALERAAELTPDRRQHQSAPVHLAVGDAAGALAAIAPSVGGKVALAPTLLTRAHTNEALALAHLGRKKEAHRAAQQAFVAALEAASSPPDEDGAGHVDPMVQTEDRRAAAWLWAALALDVDQRDETLALLREAGGKELAGLARWVELATLPEPERLPLRWSLRMPKPPRIVLPAAMALAAHLVPGDTEVEVWLDRLFHEEHRRRPVLCMLARAEAARWRGDGDAERRWRERAARLQKLQVDYATSLLAHLAELR